MAIEGNVAKKAKSDLHQLRQHIASLKLKLKKWNAIFTSRHVFREIYVYCTALPSRFAKRVLKDFASHTSWLDTRTRVSSLMAQINILSSPKLQPRVPVIWVTLERSQLVHLLKWKYFRVFSTSETWRSLAVYRFYESSILLSLPCKKFVGSTFLGGSKGTILYENGK